MPDRPDLIAKIRYALDDYGGIKDLVSTEMSEDDVENTCSYLDEVCDLLDECKSEMEAY